MTNLPVDEEAIFKVACEIASAEARTVYLRQVCSDDQALFDRVAALLKVRDEEPSFLESPPSELAATMEPSDVREQPGEQIGPYRLLQIIGEGGMGVVYMAEQTHPVKRRVALKIIKPGMDSRQVIARFEAERQALAMMDHPNIAKIYDAGTVEAGCGRRETAGKLAEQTPSASSLSPLASSLRPYFVMELVRGVPITEYCDQHELTPRERLALFADVCHAVQHAHQKGVIHRDIKPSNVLVADYDDKPVPKIIDFGLAKAVSFSLTDMTNFTRLGQVVGTFEYMSPEQAKLNQLDVDTRTDVYSLGVLLYELLTGSTPFDRERLRSAALDELLRIIRDEDPPKPSTRISSLGQTAASLSAKRKTDPQRLMKQVRGDLDWIVMKALEKDRARRYETAAELAAEAVRYLNDEHVLASPPSKLYRLKRTVRRHRGPVVAAGLLLLSLLVGIAGTTWGLVNVRRERDVAEERLTRLREELESMAVMHAMNGNVEHMRQSVNDAMEAGATKGWAKSVEAVPAIFSGEWENSIMLLEEARQEGEDTLAVHGMLGLVRGAQGDGDEFIHEFEVLRNRLKDAAPRRFQDKVFCAMFLTYFEPEDSYQWANDAFAEYRSPVALAVRSTTRTLLACNEQDIDQAEQAIAEASAAAVFMPDSPFLLSSRLSSHLMALYLGRDTKDDNFIRRHREAGRELAERLEAFPHYAVGHGIAADFYEEIGDVAEARRRYQLHDSLKASYSAFLLRQNEIDEATKVLSGIPLDGFFLDSHIIACDHEEMRTVLRDRLVTELRDQSLHNIYHINNLSRLCLLGFGECATSEAERVISTQAEIDPVERELLLVFAGKSTMKELDRLTESFSRPQCLVHYMVGCRLLGQRDREGALAEFAKCKPMIGGLYSDVARTILKRMEDPRWPRWMTDNAEVQTPPAKQTR